MKQILLTTTPHVLLNTWGVVDSKNVSITTTTHVLLNMWGVVDSKNFHLQLPPTYRAIRWGCMQLPYYVLDNTYGVLTIGS